MIEIWKDISGFEKLYQISNLGRVKSLSKKVYYSDGRIRTYPEKILKNRIDGKGYYFVTLYHDSFNSQIRVHQLVAKEFILNPKNKPCVNHIDSNRKNNNVKNLLNGLLIKKILSMVQNLEIFINLQKRLIIILF